VFGNLVRADASDWVKGLGQMSVEVRLRGSVDEGHGSLPAVPLADRDGAVDALYRAMQRDLIRLAAVLIDDRRLAEELVQEAFIGLYRRWPELADHAAAPAYLRRSVVNACHSELRRRAFRRGRPEPIEIATTGPADSAALLAEEHRAVLDAIGRLPTRQREVVLLRYWQGLSEAEIAEALGISTGSVKSAASRGLGVIERRLRRRES
jgi:RNA polymerase sigma-70 factor (sigma-E family)